MDLYTEITSVYEELTVHDFDPNTGTILLRDDGDGIQYLSNWNYEKPIPKGIKLGK